MRIEVESEALRHVALAFHQHGRDARGDADRVGRLAVPEADPALVSAATTLLDMAGDVLEVAALDLSVLAASLRSAAAAYEQVDLAVVTGASAP